MSQNSTKVEQQRLKAKNNETISIQVIANSKTKPAYFSIKQRHLLSRPRNLK